MPRVTLSEHYDRYEFLHTAWNNFSMLFSLLPLPSQRQDHEFYRPAETLTKDVLAAHIQALGMAKPALVNQVGKHVQVLMNGFKYISEELGLPESAWPRALRSVPGARQGSVTVTHDEKRSYAVRSVARPQIDMDKLARALIMMAEEKVTAGSVTD